jgi:hypothetical protein
MKKLIAFVTVSVLMLSSSLAYATGTETVAPEYNAYTLTTELNFAAVVNNDGNVETSWDTYIPENFNYYKVVRSQDNSDPVYPDDGYIFAGGEGETSYTDASVPAGISYYRVCSIAKPERYCSPVVTIESEGSTAEPEEPVDPAILAEITLEGSVNEDGTVDLTWIVDDDTKITAGFKIVYSKINEEPVYPGDSYAYLTDSAARTHKLEGLKAGYTYYIRACQYNGNGVCLAYSNTITAVIEGTAAAEPAVYKAEDVTFVDTTEHWAEAYADNLKNSCGVLGYKNEEGVPTGYFSPDSPITRAELAKMLVNCTYGELAASDVESYSDIDPAAWYAIYVFKAQKLGWIEGYDDGTFRPNNNVNRAEALKMILASKIAVELITGGSMDFSDISGEEWFVDYVAYAVAEDIVEGYSDGTFKPGNPITRAEAAKIISLVYSL